MSRQKPIRLIVNVPLSITPFYTKAEEMDAIEGETASVLEIAQRLAAIDVDKPWDIVADIIRPYPDVQIEAEASELILNKEKESESTVVYAVILTFNERFEPVDQSKNKLSPTLVNVLATNGFTCRFEDR